MNSQSKQSWGTIFFKKFKTTYLNKRMILGILVTCHPSGGKLISFYSRLFPVYQVIKHCLTVTYNMFFCLGAFTSAQSIAVFKSPIPINRRKHVLFFSKVLKSTNPAILDKTTFNVCCCTLVKEKPAGCKTIPQSVILFTVHHHTLFLSYNKMAMGDA